MLEAAFRSALGFGSAMLLPGEIIERASGISDAPVHERAIGIGLKRLLKTLDSLLMVVYMSIFQRYDASVSFLRNLDDDWARLVDLVGPCLHDPKAAREPYEALIRAIGYQQLTAKAGDAIISRLKALYPESAFPTPKNIISAEFDSLRACGFSATKIATIKAIAEGSLSGLVPTRVIATELDDETLIERIVTIKGIGRWTVEMLLMYSLERMDILPVDDFGVREGYRALKSLDQQPKPKALKDIGLTWSPHRTVASWYLWRMPRERGNVLK